MCHRPTVRRAQAALRRASVDCRRSEDDRYSGKAYQGEDLLQGSVPLPTSRLDHSTVASHLTTENGWKGHSRSTRVLVRSATLGRLVGTKESYRAHGHPPMPHPPHGDRRHRVDVARGMLVAAGHAAGEHGPRSDPLGSSPHDRRQRRPRPRPRRRPRKSSSRCGRPKRHGPPRSTQPSEGVTSRWPSVSATASCTRISAAISAGAGVEPEAADLDGRARRVGPVVPLPDDRDGGGPARRRRGPRRSLDRGFGRPGGLRRLDGPGSRPGLHAAGLTRVRGSVVGDTSAFTREWWAPGWVPGLSRSYVNRATALAFDANAGSGLPEERAAAALSAALESRGVVVAGAPRAAALDAEVPSEGATDLTALARISSPPLRDLLATQNHGSVNFYAEMLVKALGASDRRAGLDRRRSRSRRAMGRGWGVEAQVRDGSGLSHSDRVSTQGVVSLLLLACANRGRRRSSGRFPAPARARSVTASSACPCARRPARCSRPPSRRSAATSPTPNGSTVAFSVMSRGLDKATAASIEDEIVRILAAADVG